MDSDCRSEHLEARTKLPGLSTIISNSIVYYSIFFLKFVGFLLTISSNALFLAYPARALLMPRWLICLFGLFLPLRKVSVASVVLHSYLTGIPQLSCGNTCQKWHLLDTTTQELYWWWHVTYIPQEAWWRHQMETLSALLALCGGNSSVTGEFPSQRPVTRSFAVFFHLCPNKRLSKQSWGWWFETPSPSLWRHCNEAW